MSQPNTSAFASTWSGPSFLVIFAAFLWGITFYFQKEAMDHIGPFLFNALRGMIATIVLLPLALGERQRSAVTDGRVLQWGIAGGLVFLVAGAFQQAGIATATLTNTAFLTALYVVISPFLFWLLRGEQLGARVWLCAIFAFAGIWLLGGGTIGLFSTGDVLVAISAFFWSLLMVVTSAAGHFGKPYQYTLAQFSTLTVVAFPLSWALESVRFAAIKSALPSLLFVGAVGSALTYAIIATVVRHIPASRVSILLSTEVLFASAAGFWILGERLSAIQWIGALILFCAVVAVQIVRAEKALTE